MVTDYLNDGVPECLKAGAGLGLGPNWTELQASLGQSGGRRNGYLVSGLTRDRPRWARQIQHLWRWRWDRNLHHAGQSLALETCANAWICGVVNPIDAVSG